MSSINRNDALTMANLITLVKVLMKIDKKKTKVVRKWDEENKDKINEKVTKRVEDTITFSDFHYL